MTGWMNMGSTAPFQGVIDTDDDRAVLDEGVVQGVQQGACQLQPRPSVAAEHAVKGGEAGLAGQTEGVQQIGDGARNARQHRTDRERRHRGAGTPREVVQVGPEPRDKTLRKGEGGVCNGAPAGGVRPCSGACLHR